MKGNFKAIIFYIALILVIVLSVSAFFGPTKEEKMVYSDIVEYFKTDSVVSFYVDEEYYLTMKVVNGDYAVYDENGIVTEFNADKTKEIGYQLRSLELFHTDLENYIATNANLTEYEYEPQTTFPWWVSLLPYVILIAVFIFLWIFAMNSASGKNGKMGMGVFGKARVKMP
ncbi:MAG: hypothetical protein J6B12_00355, partial [Clostridia bacterium]|nr:hypothetical protein [Clostridia bacterium]